MSSRDWTRRFSRSSYARAESPTPPAALSKKKAEALAALNVELTAAKKAATDAAAALKAAQDMFAVQSKAHSEATATVAENQKKVAALTPMVKPAADAVAPAKAAMDAANAAVAPAKAALDAANAEARAANGEITISV